MEEFIKKIKDLSNRSYEKNILTHTSFLTPTERQVVLNNTNGANVLTFGGNETCERTIAFFLPDYMEEVCYDEYITVFKADFSFRKLSHRDFLGALLALGIERRCVGDIFVFENSAYFFVTKDIENYIKSNFDRVGNVGIKLGTVDFSDVKVREPKFEEINFTVASLRLDSAVAGAIKESREKANNIIKSGSVLLNYLECLNVSCDVKENDVFSVKGYGKFLVSNVGGVSRRGKIFVELRKFV